MGKIYMDRYKIAKKTKILRKRGEFTKKAEIKPSMRRISRENGVDVAQKPYFGKI